MEEKLDKELMALVKKKYRPALEELYDRYIKLIYGFIFKFTNGNEEKTKEIVQLVFLKLWTTKSSYNPEKGNFVNWLLTVTRNVCVDYVRKDSIHIRNNKQMDLSKPIDIEDPNNDIENGLINSEIAKAKNKLSKPQKRLIDLLYWKGYSLTEIAKIENEPIGTIKSRLHQSLKQLKKYLEVGDL
ncbi:RNA polymerase [Peribacillus butanolivorans]|uniref:RNA polymerase sigma factor n=1 Tax=Peribacillus butanolivorans TaxID=421767 RepID=UPI0006A74441|nr:sigma-70 family RNA polymerase sigma factor [Peribacillus butanolivorans]KON70884.1 RNA polymerase [Peribacillus butanolivorans]KQU18893.1 RNA polymerase [Bacillus sp. Leaf13]KRF67752.1 RNA polymerase [Bacillus sp. Soil768D1]MED3690805.1 sigma-70 family RNA polymerase sigma factor [Peribacillus butanolivorans]